MGWGKYIHTCIHTSVEQTTTLDGKESYKYFEHLNGLGFKIDFDQCTDDPYILFVLQ